MLTTNQVLQQGRYRIVNPFGQNGTGSYYEVYDTVHNINVVIKEIPFGLNKVTTSAQIEANRLAFADEAKVLLRIQHPTLLKVHDYFSEIDTHYLVAEFFGGNSPGEMLEKTKQAFSLAEVSDWAENLLDALGYLHGLAPPIAHRAVKPENLKLTSEGKIKLLVFNLTENRNATRHSKLNFLPLEQIWTGLDAASQNLILNSYDENAQKNLEKTTDASSDIYALGATLYYLLTARLPVDALERSIEILDGKTDPLPSPREVNQSVPAEISDVLMKSLEIRRENRFHSAVIMRQVWRTAFVRVKERETARRTEEDLLEIPSAAQNDLEAERRQIEQERLKIEAEQKRQAELLEQQKLEAEKSAIDEDFPEILEAAEILSAAVESDDYFPEVISEEKPTAVNYPANEFMDLYAEPQNESKVFKQMAAFAAALIILGGVGFGIWFFKLSKSDTPNQTISSSEQTAPTMNAEAVTMPSKTESTPETIASPAPSASPEAIQTSTISPSVKTKTIPTQTPKPEVKKPNVATAKTPEPQKKPVTVDDLINDN